LVVLVCFFGRETYMVFSLCDVHVDSAGHLWRVEPCHYGLGTGLGVGLRLSTFRRKASFENVNEWNAQMPRTA
jgi:hypothetical protein